MYKVRKEITFEAAHRSQDYDGKCKSLHGHSYRVVAEVRGDDLYANDMLFDFGNLKAIMQDRIFDVCDHAVIVDLADKELLTAFIDESRFFMEEGRLFYRQDPDSVTGMGDIPLMAKSLVYPIYIDTPLAKLAIINAKSSVENLARIFFIAIADALNDDSNLKDKRVLLHSVTVYEAGTSSATYSKEKLFATKKDRSDEIHK